MNRHERGLEFKVGIFVFVGLAMLGALLVQFGRLGEGFKTYYTVTVRFSDASGLLKGTDVLLAGARIGKVAGGPKLLREGDGVAVPLKIYDYIKIPKEAKFTVGSSGLLGDRFVNVAIPPGPQTAYLPPNAEVTCWAPERKGSARLLPSVEKMLRLTRRALVAAPLRFATTTSQLRCNCLQPLAPHSRAAPLSNTMAVVPSGPT